jgi:cystathionine beta-lyase
MWVADMDFRSPEPIIRAMQERVAHGVFGYAAYSADLIERLCARLAERYNWTVIPDDIILMPGVISGFNTACRAFGRPGNQILLQPPVYFPMLAAPKNQGQQGVYAPLQRTDHNGHLHYEIDFDQFERAITAHTGLFMLCNPHNPVGRSYTPEELTRMANICARREVIICSDEIHCELMLDGQRHTPIASLGPEIAGRCITLMAPSKTFNIPGLAFSFAVVQNPTLRAQLKQAMAGIVPHVKTLEQVAALAAYRDCDDWLQALLTYLTANRNYLLEFVHQKLPGVKTTSPQGTYLAWLDCREAGIEGDPVDFFLEKGRVGLSKGAVFGPGGEGFVRLNFGCPRSLLAEGLERMRAALVENN